jgi:hypothetical protein
LPLFLRACTRPYRDSPVYVSCYHRAS